MSKKFSTPKMSFNGLIDSVASPNANNNNAAAPTTPPVGSVNLQLGRPTGALAVPLALIKLDLNQPRKQIPANIREHIAQGQGLVEVMRAWAEASKTPLIAAIDSDQRAIDRGLLAIRQRAASIKKHGLIQSVTLNDNSDGTYTVQVGETRVLAYAWLLACGESAFDEIPATIGQRSTRDYTRKYVENVEREDLSGVEKMISVCQALYELSGKDVPDFNDTKTLDYMRQVRDEMPTRHGFVEWKAVEEDLNLHTQLRYYLTQLLDLPREALEIALAHRVAEGTLRTLMSNTRMDPEMRMKVLQTLAQQADTEDVYVWTSSNVMQTLARLRGVVASAPASSKPADTVKLGLRNLKAARRAFGELKGRALESAAKQLAADPEAVAVCVELKALVDRVVGATAVGKGGKK